MAEPVDLHIGRVVEAEIAQWYLHGDPLDRIKMHCLHGVNLFNHCLLCDHHFTNRALSYFKQVKEREA